MSPILLSLCAATALVCAVLLLQGWRATHSRLLWWSGLCFSGFFVGNLVLVLDKLILPQVDLQPLRLTITLASMVVMLYGLVGTRES